MDQKEQKYTDAAKLRKKAERRLRDQQKKFEKLSDETDTKRLLHELQVHQIELEMQNEELQNAYDMAELSLKKYTMLYDFAPIGYLTIEKNGVICDSNFTAANLLNEKRWALIDSNLMHYIPEISMPVFKAFIEMIFENNTRESCKLLLTNSNNDLINIYLEGIVSIDHQTCLIGIIDINRFNR